MAESRMYFARSGVVIGSYYAAYGFTADVNRFAAPRSGFVQQDVIGSQIMWFRNERCYRFEPFMFSVRYT
jgi:hypothetical protein